MRRRSQSIPVLGKNGRDAMSDPILSGINPSSSFFFNPLTATLYLVPSPSLMRRVILLETFSDALLLAQVQPYSPVIDDELSVGEWVCQQGETEK
ncbi:hypothetical protein MLD38_017274 [Melastoma candidum]|uniref:Uncharacterized protein n=1 Tax=Melastoma candidum TaxID=119954 RepID=A0ACB9QQ69_9MYRT|nr:hypothetical protein MLD38_017274 [Melastoma candidum]